LIAFLLEAVRARRQATREDPEIRPGTEIRVGS
jgi:hypothetical protein